MAWMTASQLLLNANKNCGWIRGTMSTDSSLMIRELNVLGSVIKMVNSARDLGVVVDSRLTMTDHIASVCQAAYYQLCQMRLYYYNSVLNTITENLFQLLQFVQNMAAMLIMRTGWREHIRRVLQQLHWLPV